MKASEVRPGLKVRIKPTSIIKGRTTSQGDGVIVSEVQSVASGTGQKVNRVWVEFAGSEFRHKKELIALPRLEIVE
jgi:hypothetical protein